MVWPIIMSLLTSVRSPQRMPYVKDTVKGRQRACSVGRPQKNWEKLGTDEWWSAPSFLNFLFQLPNPLLQELALWFLLGQGQSLFIRGPSFDCSAEPAVHVCTGGMRQVIVGQFALFQHRVDLRQTGLWTIGHCNG